MRAITIITLLFMLAGFATATEVIPGVYDLKGKNPGASENSTGYQGRVVIEKNKSAKSYKLYWFIGKTQTQHGVATLDGDLLTVSYFDDSGTDKGVVLFTVTGTTIKGKWKSDYEIGDWWGFEELTLQSEKVAQELNPAPVKQEAVGVAN